MVATTTQATAIEQAKAVAEVAAAVRVAQDIPRDLATVIREMETSCSQPALANRAFYSVPRAGGRIEGSSVHLARELARCWGNVDYGIRELRRDDEAHESEMQAWAWDQQANVRSSRSFIVKHKRMAKDRKTGVKAQELLVDLADISNNNNSQAARALRETIFTVLPVWFREQAEAIATKTLNGETDGKTPEQRKADAIRHYEQQWNVTREQLERRLDRPVAQWTSQDVGFLLVLNGELSRGEKRVEDEFPAPSAGVTADEITGAAS
jgi:hypothetical protein